MKKIILTLALMAFAFGANAQFVIGGNLNVNHGVTTHDDDYNFGTTTNNISILPKVGYQLNKDMQVGVQLGWDYSYTRNYTGGGDDDYTSGANTSEIVINPYFRYNFATWKKLTFFAEANLRFGLGLETTTHTVVAGNETTTDNGDNYISLGLGVVPGINYAFSKKFSMDIYINLASLGWSMTDGDDWGDHNWHLGVDANSQTLNAHLNNFSIGFNYHL